MRRAPFEMHLVRGFEDLMLPEEETVKSCIPRDWTFQYSNCGSQLTAYVQGHYNHARVNPKIKYVNYTSNPDPIIPIQLPETQENTSTHSHVSTTTSCLSFLSCLPLLSSLPHSSSLVS
jgi:hypothetical protein